MITTYALSLPTVDCTEQHRIVVIDIVSDWLVEHYPLDARGPGTTVRTRRLPSYGDHNAQSLDE